MNKLIFNMTNNRPELLQTLIENLAQTTHRLHTSHSFPFGNLMLRKQQIMILFFIYEKKSVASVKDIAKFLHVTPGAITQFVDGLVKENLVKREKNITDGRIINIKLTTSTEKQFNKFKNAYLESASKAFSHLSDNELKQFIKLLKKVKTQTKL
jgi:DNA-binding MarR family transcriptional regulator